MTCLLRDRRDLLPAWHRLKTDKGAVARGLRRGRTWGHWRVPSSPWEECLLKPSCAVRQRDLAVPGKLDREGFVFPPAFTAEDERDGASASSSLQAFPKGSAGDLGGCELGKQQGHARKLARGHGLG